MRHTEGMTPRRGLAVLAALLLILSIGLQVYAQQTSGALGLTTILLIVYVAAWLFALGLFGAAGAFLWWLQTDLIVNRPRVVGMEPIPVRLRRAWSCRT